MDMYNFINRSIVMIVSDIV